MNIERRSCQLELREEDGQARLEGYAAVFYDESDPGTEYTIEMLGEDLIERIAPQAFNETLARPDPIHALWNHDPGYVLAYNLSGTLELGVDERGLRFSLNPPNTQVGRDVMELARRGDLGGASIGFQVEDQAFRKCKGKSIREIRKCKLRDVSAVAQPAYKATTVAARSLQEAYREWVKEQEELQVRRIEALKARCRIAEIGIDPRIPLC